MYVISYILFIPSLLNAKLEHNRNIPILFENFIFVSAYNLTFVLEMVGRGQKKKMMKMTTSLEKRLLCTPRPAGWIRSHRNCVFMALKQNKPNRTYSCIWLPCIPAAPV